MIMLSFIIAFVGFVFLSMAMKRHFKQLWSKRLLSLGKVIIFRCLGSVLLVGSGVLCITSEGTGIGLVYWCGLLTFAALLQSMLLTYLPSQLFSQTRNE